MKKLTKADEKKFLGDVKQVIDLLISSHGFEDLSKPISTRLAFGLIGEFHVISRDALEAMETRVERLEKGIVAGVRYCGVWQRQMTYNGGDLVTREGALWHANQESIGVEPGDGMTWTLCAKGNEIPKTRAQHKGADRT